MVGVASSRGLTLDTYKALALLEADGTQGGFYLGLVRDAIGANPYFRIYVGVDLKYEDTIVGSLNVVSNTIVLPTAFNEPAETWLAATVTGTCTVEIVKASDSGVALVIPIAKAADNPLGDKWTLSGDLQAGVAVKTSSLRILAPGTLDVGGGGTDIYATPPTSGVAVTMWTLANTPVVVSPTLFGGQFHFHPTPRPGDGTFADQGGTGSMDAVPPMQIKSIGSLARIGCTWAAIVREGFTWYDSWKTWGNSFGAIRNYTLFQTPNELATSGYSANNSYWPTFNPGGDKGNVPPVAGAAKTFARSIMDHDSTLATFESWNEYEIYPTGYWQGTKEQMARVMRECNEARIESGHSCKILWPGMVNWDYTNPDVGFDNWAELAAASDGAGGQAKDHIQGFGHHIYSSYGTTALSMSIYFRKVQASMNAMGKGSLPKYMTEGALIPDGASFDVTLASNIYGWQYALCAIYGYVSCNSWSMDRGASGNWGGHVPWFTTQFRAKHDLLVNGLHGKKIGWAYVMTNNTIQIGTNDGNILTV